MGTAAHAETSKRGYIVVPSQHAVRSPATVSHVIFMDRCVGGCTITPGNDGTQNQSSIVSSTKNLSAFGGTDAQWQSLVSCVRATYAPFNVQIVDTRPASGPYHHAIVAGTAAQGGFGSGTLGVSPFTSDCSYIPNAMSFSFANSMLNLSNAAVEMCWTVSQETAHSWGLDHKFDKLDPQTYLENGNVQKVFQNQAGSCGEYSARACSCAYPGTGTASMNSYALIMATFGSGTPDTTPPTVSITAPSNNGSVMPSFAITATAMDDQGISKVEFKLDNTLIGTASSAPFKATAPASLTQGSHHLEATAYDFANNTAKAAIDVVYGESCTSGGCSDPTQVCLDGHCVAGPDTQGGLGSPCTDNAGCASGQCGDDGAGNRYCVEPCDTTNNMCPSGFGCLATTGTAGVCWPGESGGGGGCNTSGSNGLALLAGLGFATALITRRRRR
jgi:uncharacterized protein (TIGR03382 family)